jgi:ABC-type transport system substrate-binding protein
MQTGTGGGNPGELKMLPAGPGGTGAAPAVQPAAPPPNVGATGITATTPPPRQMSEMPREELDHLAEEFGIDATRFRFRQALVAAIHDRRQMIAAMDRDAMLDVIRWGRRPVTVNATREQIAQEIVRIGSMRFAGLSQRGLVVLARMRGLEARGDDPVPVLVRRLKKKEGLFSKISRKRRAMLGAFVAKIVGEDGPTDYQFVPPAGGGQPAPTGGAVGYDAPGGAARPGSIKQEIEESGLLGGITSRIKKSADSYVNQKLDEIEARIDRKLDEIDRRLAEWRDKEIANRIRILKITLWASVIVAICSLIYTYVDYHFLSPQRSANVRPEPAAVAKPPPPRSASAK